MRKAKLWSVLLVAVLLCACVLGTLLLGADAANQTVLNVTGTAGTDSFATVEAALAEAERMAGAGELTTAGVKIVVSENQTATVDANGILFGQKTIWLNKEEGKKLPITITGTSSTVSIGMPAGNVACTNDYTFVEMKVAVGDQETYFYAGSGNVVFEKVTFGNTSGFFYGDNFTQAAYEGWPLDYSAMKNEKGLVESSLTFGENSEYSIDVSNKVAAVGYTGKNNPLASFSAVIADNQIQATKEEAIALTFAAASGLENLPDIKPVNTKASVTIDTKPTASEISGKNLCFYAPTTRSGFSPVAEAELNVYSGVIKILRGDSSAASWKVFVGDNYINIYGGTFTNNDHCFRGLNKSSLIGSFYVYATQLDPKVKTEVVGTTGGLQVTSNAPRVTGECKLVIDGGTFKDIYGGTSDTKVTTIVNGGTFKRFYGARYVTNGKGEIENIITGGTFTNTAGAVFYGSYASSSWPMNAKSITNRISGGTFNATDVKTIAAYPSSASQAYTQLVDGITNEYLENLPDYGDTDGVGPVFNGYIVSAYLKDSGKILNKISGGTFNGAELNVGISIYLGAHTEHKGGIENVIDGGTFANYVFAGGTKATCKISNTKGSLGLDGNTLPSIKTTINGGTFHGFWGAFGSVSGTVHNIVNGGTFYPYQKNFNNSDYANAFAGGGRSAAATTMPDIINDIYGGTFRSNFYGGSGLHGKATELKIYDSATVNTNLYGGIFEKDIRANSKHVDFGPLAGTANLTVDPSKSATPLKILGNLAVTDGETSSVTLVGGEEAVLIGKNTNIIADAVTGTLQVEQTEGWLAHDYLTIPAGSQYRIIESPDVFGSYVADDTILVKGAAVASVGATLRLGERLGVRIVLNREDVEKYGEAFTYTVKLGGTTVASGTYEEIKANNYSILFDGIGLSKFGEKFVVTSPVMEEISYSVVELAAMAQTAWADNAKWKAYADAIIEFNNVYNLDAENTMTPEAVEKVPAAAKGALGDAIVAGKASASLLMSDAAGIKMSIELTEAPESAKFVVAGKEFAATIAGNTISAEIFFAHEALAEEFVISVQNAEGQVYLTYTASIEAIANQMYQNEANENKDNAQAFLVYIQKAVACK